MAEREERIILIRVDASAAVDGSRAATAALERMERGQAAAAVSLGKLEQSLGRVGGYLKAQLALMIADVGSRLLQIGKDAFNAAAGLDELAEQLGTNARALQGMQFAAVQNGVKLEQLETGISKFSQKMGEAAEGSKEMIEALTKLGVKNLDVTGKLRPTEDLLVDVAKAITSIEDPAKRSAAAVDFFGKAGTRMLPLLTELAKGTDSWVESARKAGAMISDDTIVKLDKLADKMEKNKLIWRANAAEGLASLEDWRNGFNAWADSVAASVDKWATETADSIGKFLDGLAVEGARGSAMFIEAFKAMPELLGDVFANAWSFAKSATAEGINELTAVIASSKVGRLLGLEGGTNLDTALTLRGSSGLGDRITAAGDSAAAEMQARAEEARRARFSESITPLRATSTIGDARSGGTVGAGTSAIKGSGKEAEDAEKKYAKLITQLDLAVAAQDNMTAAAGRGEQAYAGMKVHLDAQQKALEIYGKALDDNDPRLKKLEERMLKIAQGKVAEQFSLTTTELQNQNEILETQIRLMGQSPEIIAKEIALLKVKQDVEKAGGKITQEEIDRRTQIVDTGERLKIQAEELKKAQELWTAPLKSALESIQQTAADAFEKMLESGKVNFTELGSVFKKIIIRMAAEFLALETVRPVMSVLVNAISPSTARAMGLDANAGGMTGGGGLGGGGISDFLGQTLFGGGENFGPPMAGQSFASLGSSGGLSVGGALGGIAGLGMGAFQLFSGGGSASSMIGGGASMLGGAVGLLGPLLGLGAAAGPIGMGIGLLGSILPSLFGGGTPEPPTVRAGAGLSFSGGRFNANAGYGDGSGLAGALGGTGQGMAALLKAAGFTARESAADIQLQSLTKGDFSNQTVLVNGRQWGQSSDPQMQKQAIDSAAANVAHSMMLQVGSGISDIMRQGLAAFGTTNLEHAFSTEELSQAVAEIKTFDDALKNLGKTTSDAEAALTQIDESFAGLFDTAAKYGFDAADLNAKKAAERLRVGTDFTTALERQFMDPSQAALFDIGEERTNLLRNNSALVGVTGYLDQANRIEELYAKKRTAIIEEQAKAQADALQAAADAAARAAELAASKIQSLQDLIDRLTYGDLANASPTTAFSGTRATYMATLAQARAGSADAMDRLGGTAEAYATAGRSYFASSGEYAALVDQIRKDLQERQGAIATGADPTGSNEQINLLFRTIAQQSQMFADAQNENRQLREQISALIAELQRAA